MSEEAIFQKFDVGGAPIMGLDVTHMRRDDRGRVAALLSAYNEVKADNARLRDLVVKFQSGKPSTLFLEGHTG